MNKIQNIKFPDLLLDKQDKSDEYGYHWIETKYKDRRTQTCILLREENGKGYYLPLNPPYELCREDNFPRKESGYYIIQHSDSIERHKNNVEKHLIDGEMKDVLKIQLSEFMEIFGKNMYCGADSLIENNNIYLSL